VRIVITGSLAHDYIMSFPGYFKDHILPEKAHALSVSFLVDSMKRMRGGVAGNIAYTLALLGERPLVVGAAGQDFGEYRTWMESHGIDTSGIAEIENEFTASCFINTDRANNQIVALYTGAMAYSRQLSIEGRGLSRGDLAVVSPSDPEAMGRVVQESRKLGLRYIFDPGKQMPRLERAQILDGLTDAYLLIANDYELAMIAQKIGRTEEQVIAAAPICVVTRGERGSTFYSGHGRERTEIPIAPVSDVRDPTGAGDAYLAGVAFGIVRRLSWPATGRIAALAAAYAIEQRGCQEHHFTPAEFGQRFATAFGHSAEVERALTSPRA